VGGKRETSKERERVEFSSSIASTSIPIGQNQHSVPVTRSGVAAKSAMLNGKGGGKRGQI